MTSRKMVIAVCTPWTVVSRSSLMSLIMTFMFEPAKLQMNCARARGTSTPRSDSAARPATTGSVMSAAFFEQTREVALQQQLPLGLGEICIDQLHVRTVEPLAHQIQVSLLSDEEESRRPFGDLCANRLQLLLGDPHAFRGLRQPADGGPSGGTDQGHEEQ